MENRGAGTITQATYAGNFAILHGETLQNLTVDLSEVPYMDLSGVATLLEALKTARARTIGLELTGLHDRPRYLLELTGLLSLFET